MHRDGHHEEREDDHDRHAPVVALDPPPGREPGVGDRDPPPDEYEAVEDEHADEELAGE